MRVKELKAILNQSTVLDECKIYICHEDRWGGEGSTHIICHVEQDRWQSHPVVHLTALAEKTMELPIGVRLEDFDPKTYFGDKEVFDENGVYVGWRAGDHTADGKE